MMARAFTDPYRPVAAHLIPTRRCNLSCAYCNEFDDLSQPVPTCDVLRRVDLLSALGTSIVTLSGGEPLLHPDVHEIVSAIRQRGMIATLITNGYLLTVDRITRLNRAGLDYLQISIDNVMPDEVSKKSLEVLDQKLHRLAGYAEFDVTINVVLGSAVRRPDDALVIARRAAALGFSTTVGIIHDQHGQLLPLTDEQRSVLDTVTGMEASLFDFANIGVLRIKVARIKIHHVLRRVRSRSTLVGFSPPGVSCSYERRVDGRPARVRSARYREWPPYD